MAVAVIDFGHNESEIPQSLLSLKSSLLHCQIHNFGITLNLPLLSLQFNIVCLVVVWSDVS